MKGLDKHNDDLLNRHLQLEEKAAQWHEAFLFQFDDLKYSDFEQKYIIDKIEFFAQLDSDPCIIGRKVSKTLETWFKFKKEVCQIAGRKFTDEVLIEEFYAGDIEYINSSESAIYLMGE